MSMKWLRENAAAIMAIMAILTPLLLYASSIDGRLDAIEKDVLAIKKDLSALKKDLSAIKRHIGVSSTSIATSDN